MANSYQEMRSNSKVIAIVMRISSIFDTQQVATRRNRVAKTCATCCDMLRQNVAIVWPELANAGPTVLRYVVVLICCDRLAGALEDSNVEFPLCGEHRSTTSKV